MGLLTPEQEQEQLQRIRGIGSAAVAQPEMQPIGGEQPPATLGAPDAPARPVIARPNSGPRGVTLPAAPYELNRSMMPSQTQLDQENLNHEKNLTPKIWRPGGAGGIKNPILRAMARVADVAGTAMFPSITGQIPGTELHHKLQVQGAQGRVNQDLNAADVQSQTTERNAQAQHLLNPQLKEGITPEETTIHDLMTGENGQPRINPQTNQPYTYLDAFSAVKQAGQDAKPDKAPTEFGEWRKANPKAPLSDWFDLKNSAKPDTSAEADNKYRAIEQKLLQGQAVTPEEQAFVKAHEKLKTLGPVTSANLAAPGKNDARADRSYQFNSGQLEKVGQPIDQAMQRMGNLQESLKQGTPQADALVAPELLSIMAGGSGSGLRMNEAEISRIVGARSNWETLKASANKWRTDPKAANSITAAQRQQIRALVDAVNQKLAAKQAILDEARQGLINADDPHDHRKIVADTKKKLDAIDGGAAQGGSSQGGGEEVEYVRDASGKLVPKK